MAKKTSSKDCTMTPEVLVKVLQAKETLPDARNILVILGEEDYYRSQILKLMPQYLFEDILEADREISFLEKNTDLSELSLVINTYPFFSGKSLVILSDEKLWETKQIKNEDNNDANNNQDVSTKKLEKLASVITDIPDYCTLVINAKKLDKRTKFFKQLKEKAVICNCERIRYNDLDKWLQEQAMQYGAIFSYDAIGTIMEYIEPIKDDIPLGLLQQEIAKLAVYKAEAKQWKRDDVLEIFSALPNSSSFALMNSVMNGKLKESLEILAMDKKKGNNILPLCAMIAYKLRQTLSYLELKRLKYDQDGIMHEMGIKNYYAFKMLVQESRRFSEDSLRRAVLQLNELNVQLRYGGRGFERLEEILLQLLAP